MRIREIQRPTCRYCGRHAESVVAADDPLGGIMEMVTCPEHQQEAEAFVLDWERRQIGRMPEHLRRLSDA